MPIARYTGTFVGGPYDGEIRDYDRKMIVRTDPITDDQVDAQFAQPDSLPVLDFDKDLVNERVYEWIMDDDGRGWWVWQRLLRSYD